MLEILMRGVSTRNYRVVIPEMGNTLGVSRSSASRQMQEASEAELKELLERSFDQVKLVGPQIHGLTGEFAARCHSTTSSERHVAF
jgi:hypothetical protein